MQNHTTPRRLRTNVDTAAAVLWSSAFLLAGLVITQAGKLPINPAYGDMGVQRNGYTLLSTDSGRGEDAAPDELLYVIDSRGETLLVYEIEDARKQSILLRGGGNLQNLFRNARR